MFISITAPDLASRDAALVAIKSQQFNDSPPTRWTLSLGADGVSATLDTDSTVAPAGLPAGVVVTTLAPPSVLMWQAKAALQQAGLLAQADGAIAAAGNPALTAFWSYAPSIDRTSPTLASLAKTIGLSDPQIDALFIAAGNIAL